MGLVVFNQKGGVGKSTITCNLAAISAQQGFKTLVVDLDLQGNSSRYLLGEAANEAGEGIAGYFAQTLKFMVRPKPIGDFVIETPFENLSVLPPGDDLDDLHGKLESRGKIYKLREGLAELAQDYDRIYVDTPPSLNFYTRSALIAAEGCVIPFDCDDFSRHALNVLLANVKEIQADHNEHLKVKGIVVNQFQPRANLPQRLVREMVEEGLPVLGSYLSSSVRVKESHDLAKPMIFLDARHKLTQEYVALHEELHPAAA
ncbi:ParA family protein [Ramlibacter solisilvae]|uniref:Cobyric acid synthase n=1 Tax=Ramlibacter tataouinensis TaxID=94132 RepID=A0A127JR75_9BURK|nr:ParA family protein [Ramlibacter tataouinensis]AMO22534.1 cobyric acid synthase [Ramlibacter tataouinensis]